MFPSRIKGLLSSDSLSTFLRPCLNLYINNDQNRYMRTWKTWPNSWIPFQWKVPAPQPGYFESGDLKEGLDKFDLDQIKPNLQNLEILKNAPESVRQMFTLRFVRRHELKKLQSNEYESKLPIRRRPLDKNEYERKVIRLTITIRHLRYVIRNEQPNSAGLKIACARYVNKRYKFLIELYKMDREMCEMLCEKLEIDFKAPLPYHWPYPFQERKRTIRETCAEYCKTIKEKKMVEYKQKLKEEQVKFAEEKVQALEWIEKTMAEYNITEDMLHDKEPPLHVGATHQLLE